MKKTKSPKIATLILAAPLVSLLASCAALEPEYTQCPNIRVSDKADRAYVQGKIIGQIAYVRVNGVNARCVANSDGFNMEMELGFLMRRDISQSASGEEIPLDVTLAYLDQEGNVVGRYIHSQSAFFATRSDKSRPVFTINTNIPPSTRIVMGIGKATSE